MKTQGNDMPATFRTTVIAEYWTSFAPRKIVRRHHFLDAIAADKYYEALEEALDRATASIPPKHGYIELTGHIKGLPSMRRSLYATIRPEGECRMKKKIEKEAPRCLICERKSGVQFAIFNPKFMPFGSVCIECEAEPMVTLAAVEMSRARSGRIRSGNQSSSSMARPSVSSSTTGHGSSSPI